MRTRNVRCGAQGGRDGRLRSPRPRQASALTHRIRRGGSRPGAVLLARSAPWIGFGSSRGSRILRLSGSSRAATLALIPAPSEKTSRPRWKARAEGSWRGLGRKRTCGERKMVWQAARPRLDRPAHRLGRLSLRLSRLRSRRDGQRCGPWTRRRPARRPAPLRPSPLPSERVPALRRRCLLGLPTFFFGLPARLVAPRKRALPSRRGGRLPSR